MLEEGVLCWYPETVSLGEEVYVGHRTMLKGDTRGTLTVGDNSWIGQDCFFHSAGSITIGRRTGIGPRVMILTSTHEETAPPVPIIDAPLAFAPVAVGDGCDIGIGAILLPGCDHRGRRPDRRRRRGFRHDPGGGRRGRASRRRCCGRGARVLRRPAFGEDALEADPPRARERPPHPGPMVAALRGGESRSSSAPATPSPRPPPRPRSSSRSRRWTSDPGDEVLAADFTYPATGNAVLQRGATLRLVDADPETYCLDPEALAAALDPAHQGRPDRRRLRPARRLRAHRAAARRARRRRSSATPPARSAARSATAGSAPSALSCFSFHPRKSLTTGEGGMVVTDDAALADRLRMLRNHGTRRDGWRATLRRAGLQLPDERPQRRARPRPGAGPRGRPCAAAASSPRRSPPRWPRSRACGPSRCRTATCTPTRPTWWCSRTRRSTATRCIADLREAGVESTLGTYAMHAEPAFIAPAARGRADPSRQRDARRAHARAPAAPAPRTGRPTSRAALGAERSSYQPTVRRDALVERRPAGT